MRAGPYSSESHPPYYGVGLESGGLQAGELFSAMQPVAGVARNASKLCT